MTLFLTILLLCSVSVRAATNSIVATFSSLTNAIATSSDGDTIVIQPGTITFTTYITSPGTKGLSILAEPGTVIWVDAIPTRTGGFIFDSTLPGKLYRLSGITFISTNTITIPGETGFLQANGQGNMIRFDNLTFYSIYNHAIQCVGGVVGVIDHCNFQTRDNFHPYRVWHTIWQNVGAWGDNSWAQPSTLGTSNSMFMETCSIINTNAPGGAAAPGACDGFAGARMTFRYNTITNAHFEVHGTETGGRNRSTYQFEVYANTFKSDAFFLTPVFLRGGGGIVCSNTAFNFQGGGVGVCFLTRGPYWFPQGTNGTGANGINQWHSNSVAGLIASGTCSSGVNASTLTVVGPLVPSAYVGRTLMNMSVSGWSGATGHPFGEITANTSTTITYLCDTAHVTNMVWNTGDTYNIYQVEAALDQVGRGIGGYISGDIPTPETWPLQAHFPVYFWSNTIDGFPTLFSNAGYQVIREGRDYFNSPSGSWTPFTYPHPLALIGPYNPSPSTSTNPPVVIGGTVTLRGGVGLRTGL